MNRTMEVICGTLIWIFVVFVFSLVLLGCSRKTPVENAFDDVQQAIVSVKGTLPPECQTEKVMQKFQEIELKQQVAENVCQTQIKTTEIKYERVLGIVFFIILVFFVKIFLKK